MSIIFWVTFACLIIQYALKIFIKKDYFNIGTYIIGGVYFPLILYLFNWSSLIDPYISSEFYSIFISLNLFIILSNFLDKSTLNDYYYDFTIKRKSVYLILLNFVYLFFTLLENYLGSGYLLPAIHSIDIHTFNAIGLSYFTESLFIVILINFIYFYKTKKRKYLIWIIVFVILPVIGKSARMTVVLSLFQLAFFILFVYINDRKNRQKKDKILGKRRHKIILVISIAILTVLLIGITEYRWSGYGKYQVSFEDSISYTGPDLLSKPISIYYGYFPLSFNNLNINIKNRVIDHNYIGLYTFKSLYFGIFRLHNIFELDPYQPGVERLVTSGSATVRTGFFDFYYDYGVFTFIPILISVLIYHYLKRKAGAYNKSIFYLIVYFFWSPLWFFMSFQNVIYSGTLLIRVIIIYFISNYFIKLKKFDTSYFMTRSNEEVK